MKYMRSVRQISREIDRDDEINFFNRDSLTFTKFIVQRSEGWLDVLEASRRLLYLSSKFRHIE